MEHTQTDGRYCQGSFLFFLLLVLHNMGYQVALDGDVMPLPQPDLCNYQLIDVVKKFEFTGPRTSFSWSNPHKTIRVTQSNAFSKSTIDMSPSNVSMKNVLFIVSVLCLGSLQLWMAVHKKVSHWGFLHHRKVRPCCSGGRKGPAVPLSLEKAKKVQQVSPQNALQHGTGTVLCESAGHQHQPMHQQSPEENHRHPQPPPPLLVWPGTVRRRTM